MGAAGRDRAQHHFSIDACVRNYDSLYRGMTLNPAGRPGDLVVRDPVAGRS
jgi:hypothetical protein